MALIDIERDVRAAIASLRTAAPGLVGHANRIEVAVEKLLAAAVEAAPKIEQSVSTAATQVASATAPVTAAATNVASAATDAAKAAADAANSATSAVASTDPKAASK